MVIQITGNVAYPITLDPSVWIFDDRKILLKEAFHSNIASTSEEDIRKKTAERLNEAYHQKVRPPVNQSIHKFEREKALKNSYVMPINEFIDHAEVKSDASSAVLTTTNGEVHIHLKQLQDSLLLFSQEGKPLSDDGPVHLFFKDGSNEQTPIKGVQAIKIY